MIAQVRIVEVVTVAGTMGGRFRVDFGPSYGVSVSSRLFLRSGIL